MDFAFLLGITAGAMTTGSIVRATSSPGQSGSSRIAAGSFWTATSMLLTTGKRGATSGTGFHGRTVLRVVRAVVVCVYVRPFGLKHGVEALGARLVLVQFVVEPFQLGLRCRLVERHLAQRETLQLACPGLRQLRDELDRGLAEGALQFVQPLLKSLQLRIRLGRRHLPVGSGGWRTVFRTRDTRIPNPNPNPNGYRMGQVNSYGESRASERVFGSMRARRSE